MSNLNKAFIQAYSKDRRSVSENAPRPSAAVKTGLASPEQLESLTYYRIDAGQSNLAQTLAHESWYVSLMSQVDSSIAGHSKQLLSQEANGSNASTVQSGWRASTKAMPPSRSFPAKEDYEANIQQRRIPSEGNQHLWHKESLPTPPHFESPMAGGASSTSDVVQTAAQVVSNREPTSASFQAASFQAASFQAASFQAVWEVDAIAWPAVTNLLCSGGQSILSELGAHLVQANATGLKTMVVTSLISGAGRSTVAMCLARCAAQAGLKVALVDGDLPSPKLAEQLNIEAAHGWNEYVAGRIPLAEAAIYSIDDKITVFPFVWQADQTGPKAIQPDHPAVHDMIGRLAAVFDLVILDAQALSHPSGKVVGCFSEGLLNAAVIVTDVDLTDRPELTAAIARLERMGVQSTGIVENFQVHLV